MLEKSYIRRYFIKVQYQAEICLGEHASQVARLALIHVINSLYYTLQFLNSLKLFTKLTPEKAH